MLTPHHSNGSQCSWLVSTKYHTLAVFHELFNMYLLSLSLSAEPWVDCPLGLCPGQEATPTFLDLHSGREEGEELDQSLSGTQWSTLMSL